MKCLPDQNIKLKPCYGQEYFVVKHPLVGSGKITRRVYLEISLTTARRNRRKKKRNRQLASSIGKRQIHNDNLTFENTASKRIFDFWSSLKHPFVIHKKQKSVTTSRILYKLKSLCKKHQQIKIIEAIEMGHRLFRNPSFAYFNLYNKKKIGLHHFLQYTAKEIQIFSAWSWVKVPLKKHGIELPASWFQECLKGWQYLEKTYLIKAQTEKDEHPVLTEQAIRMMSIHRRREINDKGRRDLVKFSKMLANWGRINDIDPYWLIDHIETALNDYKTMRVDKIYYLTTEIFWTETLPDELIRYNKLHYEGRNFVYDKDEMFK